MNNSEWIPCSERLPEYSDTYLVAWLPRNRNVLLPNKQCFVELLDFDNGKWNDDIPQSGKGGFDVLAWMELPEMYRYEEGE